MKIKSLDDLKNWIQKNLIFHQFVPTVFLLSGKMGVGKTQLVKTFCELSNCKQVASSPTFSIIQEYETPKNKIYHADLYRIGSPEELEATGFWEIFDHPAYVFIEWSENLDQKRIPQNWKIIRINMSLQEDVREIQIS